MRRDRFPQCPGDLQKAGCISGPELKRFLRNKWIPGRALLPPAVRAYSHRDEGHLFVERVGARATLEDFVTYLLTRPRNSVPEPVRALLLPNGMKGDKDWPGEASAAVLLKLRFHLSLSAAEKFQNLILACFLAEGRSDGDNQIDYATDVELYTGRACREKCAARALQEAFPKSIDKQHGSADRFFYKQESNTEARQRFLHERVQEVAWAMLACAVAYVAYYISRVAVLRVVQVKQRILSLSFHCFAYTSLGRHVELPEAITMIISHSGRVEQSHIRVVAGLGAAATTLQLLVTDCSIALD
ncbi:hypothetical protein CYMTET_20730 [Cymbomonas tetramitiformis]|uniref:Uncharacterized protein n=1 Tax=Cymbomonas tetramitiformis TaxID=36881 RepID=A0AAE0G3Y0_9CHLO|nr:hypothetical protein CYMTET_20730 [Cymbomonas tetramitiformis]